MKNLSLLCTTVFSVLFVAPSFAQSDESATRVDRLERDFMLLQRQLARSGVPVRLSDEEMDSAGGAAKLEVRLSAIDEEMRVLRGKLEENEFQVRKLTETLEKLQKDTEFRFSEMGQGGAAPKELEAAAPDTERKPFADSKPDGPTTAGDGVLRAPDKNTDNFSTPHDLYNYAFRLLNQTHYEESADAFADFIKKYPKDPLIGNAYYWQGESYYIRRDYVSAADSFRQGFEALPEGPKAADNLLKLAMSLDALGRDKEACIVLKQVTTKFKNASSSLTGKAEQERKRIGCK